MIPWLYLLRSYDDAATNPCDPHCIISNRDFPTFLHLLLSSGKWDFHKIFTCIIDMICDFFNYDNWNKNILHHVKNFYPFVMDNNANKCFLFCALKFKLYETINELLSINAQIIKTSGTILMYACKNLYIPLIKTLLKYGPRLDIKDGNNNNYKWYIENNYFMSNNNVIM